MGCAVLNGLGCDADDMNVEPPLPLDCPPLPPKSDLGCVPKAAGPWRGATPPPDNRGDVLPNAGGGALTFCVPKAGFAD